MEEVVFISFEGVVGSELPSLLANGGLSRQNISDLGALTSNRKSLEQGFSQVKES